MPAQEGKEALMEQLDYEKKELTKAFCDDVYTELTDMRLRLHAMNDEFALTYGEDSEPYRTYKRHIVELADQIGWRLEILSHACPYNWAGSREKVETVVSVRPPDVTAGPEFSGGYVGG
jgi:hypothetical protein